MGPSPSTFACPLESGAEPAFAAQPLTARGFPLNTEQTLPLALRAVTLALRAVTLAPLAAAHQVPISDPGQAPPLPQESRGS
jgi:hypothetical protein